MADPRLQILRDYLGMASGGTKTDAELWEFAAEALADIETRRVSHEDMPLLRPHRPRATPVRAGRL